MMSGDEFYDDDVTSGISDFKTPDQHGETSWYAGHPEGCPCRAGGDPPLICGVCGVQVSDGSDTNPGYRWYLDEDGNDIRVCSRCRSL
jgi:hypothetical protein